jgi:hypothetical protein
MPSLCCASTAAAAAAAAASADAGAAAADAAAAAAAAEFTANWTWQGEDSGPEQFTNVYITNGWAAIRGLADNQLIRPRPQSSSSSSSSSQSSGQLTGQYVAVLRVKDGKWVVPKGVDFSGKSSTADTGSSSSSGKQVVDGGGSSTIVDVSSSRLPGCVLLGDTEDRPFPRFRLVVQDGSNRVLADSLAAPGVPIFKGRQGVACEDIRERVRVCRLNGSDTWAVDRFLQAQQLQVCD